MSDFEVSYSGSYPTMCFGKWTIKHKGIHVYSFEGEDFGTHGIYRSWHFTSGYSEYWKEYEDGLFIDEWVDKVMTEDINELKEQLSRVMTVDRDMLKELYLLINEKDWRHNSCGGCI